MKQLKQILAVSVSIILLVLAVSSCAGKDGQGGNNKQEVLADTVDTMNMEKVSKEPTFEVGNPQENTAITPHSTIGSGMVLQRRCVNRLSGTTTDPHIAVFFQDTFYYGTVENGVFEVYLPPFEAGGPYTLAFWTESGKKVLTDIYVGEVFLLAGQSNMAFSMIQCGAATQESLNQTGNPNIRLLQLPLSTAAYAKDSIDAEWEAATSDTVLNFSAFGYLFGRNMYNELSVPIGLVQAAVGGSPLSYWLSLESYEELKSKQTVFVTEAKPCQGYNGMIAPLTRLRFRGVVWYQGETNAGMPNTYEGELNCLIDSYRAIMNDFRLTFTLIELPRFGELPEGWAKIRAAQQKIAAEKENVCLSVSIDLGDMEDVHPVDKTIFAQRAAEVTLHHFFGMETQPYPTIEKAAKTENNTVVLTLNGADGLELRNGKNGFQYSTNGASFDDVSSVTVEGNCLTITAAGEIKALRYGVKNSVAENAPAKQVTVFNAYDKPLDQFEIEF